MCFHFARNASVRGLNRANIIPRRRHTLVFVSSRLLTGVQRGLSTRECASHSGDGREKRTFRRKSRQICAAACARRDRSCRSQQQPRQAQKCARVPLRSGRSSSRGHREASEKLCSSGSPNAEMIAAPERAACPQRQLPLPRCSNPAPPAPPADEQPFKRGGSQLRPWQLRASAALTESRAAARRCNTRETGRGVVLRSTRYMPLARCTPHSAGTSERAARRRRAGLSDFRRELERPDLAELGSSGETVGLRRGTQSSWHIDKRHNPSKYATKTHSQCASRIFGTGITSVLPNSALN